MAPKSAAPKSVAASKAGTVKAKTGIVKDSGVMQPVPVVGVASAPRKTTAKELSRAMADNFPEKTNRERYKMVIGGKTLVGRVQEALDEAKARGGRVSTLLYTNWRGMYKDTASSRQVSPTSLETPSSRIFYSF